MEYPTFFETLYVLVEHGIIDIDVLDDTFGYRFFAIANNPSAQDLVLLPVPSGWRDFISLFYVWERYRAAKGMGRSSEAGARNLGERYPDYIMYVHEKDLSRSDRALPKAGRR